MMFVLQVKPGTDLQVAQNLRRRGYFVRCPQRTMHIRKNGEWTEKTEPVFAGYLFLESPSSDPLSYLKYYDICETDGVIGFLKSAGKPAVLSEREEKYIQWLWNYGKPLEASVVYKNLNEDYVILSGALYKYAHQIISIDLRQRRARIRIPICGKDYRVTLPVIGI